MLAQRYYVIFVEVPSGYPGVEAIDLPMTVEYREDVLRQACWNSRKYAVLNILKGR